MHNQNTNLSLQAEAQPPFRFGELRIEYPEKTNSRRSKWPSKLLLCRLGDPAVRGTNLAIC